MIRRLVRFLKPLMLAVLVLGLLPCVAEVWLRWQEYRAGRPLLSADPRGELIAPSWQTFQQLKPLRTIAVRNPDTREFFEAQTNSFGLRGPEPAVPQGAGVLRILALGDETVLGLEVSDADAFAARLQERLQESLHQPVEVINGAVPGDCPLLSALRLKHQLAALRPDIVICHFDMSDVADDYSYRRYTVMGRGDEPLVCPNPFFERPANGLAPQVCEHFLVAKWARLQLAKLWRNQQPDLAVAEIDHPLGKYSWLEDQPPDWSVHIQQTFAALADVSQAASASRSRFLITTCPVPWQVSATASSGRGVRPAAGVAEDSHFQSELPFRLLSEFARQRGFALCDASSEFRGELNPDRLFLTNAPRLSPEGHEFYAAAVARTLIENPSLTPPSTANGGDVRSSELR